MVWSSFLLMIPDPNRQKQAARTSPNPLPPRQEKTVKLAALDGDLNATDNLSRMDAKQHLQAMLNDDKLRTPQRVKEYVRRHQRSHNHFEKIIWFDLASKRKTELNASPQEWHKKR
ncbi:hypothetical protein [Paenibacillus sp. DMB20]|uniref:hypothetical protein n=1 Tax=Paenibacillus sp. DMB20 TaxID=1642570 RepID=UPI003FA5888F